MEVRKSELTDLDDMMKLYEAARRFMAENGNPDQWGLTYPAKSLLEMDIATQKSYVCLEAGEVISTFFFDTGLEPTYAYIEEGQWLNDEPYGVVHRITSKQGHKGTASYCLDWCLKRCGNLRIDTHKENKPMLKLLAKSGFIQCGVIYLQNGDERVAFQRQL